jgi:photosystem II stability/assembly factor-like uncharacterized protein
VTRHRPTDPYFAATRGRPRKLFATSVWLWLGAACTFYTGGPPQAQGTAGAASSDGGKAAGGTGGVEASGGRGEAGGEGGASGEQEQPWLDVTGNLVGKTAADGNVVYLAASPTDGMLVAGVVGLGLWGSKDGGGRWEGLGQTGASDIISHWVMSVVFDPEDPNVFWETGIYAGGGVYVTTDGGVTTRRLGEDWVNHTDLVSIDFSDPERKTLLAGWHEANQKVVLSVDGGKTWDDTPGKTIPEVCGFSNSPLVLDARTFLVGCNNRIVRTEDAGKSWEVVSSSGGFGPPLLTRDGAVYWRADSNSGLMRSTDEGRVWTRVAGPGVLMATPVELPDGRLVSMNETHLLISETDGESWSLLGTELPFRPSGFVYSRGVRAFFAWTGSAEPSVPERSIMRFDWDYESETSASP